MNLKPKTRKTVFILTLILGVGIFIFGITRSKKVGERAESIDHYELRETQANASRLCLSCMGIE
jgi:hypothetical protein